MDNIPVSWYTSKTVLVPKTKKPTVKDLRLLLDYCEKESFKKKNLYLISMNFQKAFDSIKRDTLINALKYRIHPLIMYVIANIYSKDKTQLYFNSIHQDDITITSGIRQGCNGSSNLFLLVSFLIIGRIY